MGVTRMYNRYHGNSGRVERVEEHVSAPSTSSTPSVSSPPSRRPTPPPPQERRPPSPLSGLSGELGRILHRLSPMELETEDLLLIMILYLLYRESRDTEFLYMIGGLLLL